MNTEVISNVEITGDGELLLHLKSGGRPSYQYVYRAAAGVYWDQERKAFKFATKKDGQYAKWFAHMANVLESEMSLHLRLDGHVTWTNVSNEDKDAIQRAAI